MDNLQSQVLDVSNLRVLFPVSCDQSKLGAVLSLISLAVRLQHENIISIIKIVISFVILLNITDYLCKENMGNFAWGIIALVVFITVMNIYNFTKKSKEN